ncbi:MAG: MarR family transcriptional regulator [Crocinitomix sp.]|nr:MarR family transcriptional regulator [Crocinitomix sp.]
MNKEQLFEFHVRNNWFKISRYYNQVAAGHNMSFSWGFILLNIEKEGTPSTALGPKMGMEPTSLSRTLKNMEENGLIRRQSDSDDKRKSLVFLTEEGMVKRKVAKEVVLNFNEKVYASLPKTKVKAFFEVMEKVDVILTDLLEDKKVLEKNVLKVK